MLKQSNTSKTKLLALALAGTVIANGLMPVAVAEAGHRKHLRKHHGNHHVHKRQKRRNNNGDLIAAGIIGLAVGAIIANSAKRSEPVPAYRTYSEPQPTYRYEESYEDRRIPLDTYNQGYYEDTPRRGGPNVITYEETASLEPWTPGWRAYCADRYRSFNQQTGTFRGYDGLDHFCVPK